MSPLPLIVGFGGVNAAGRSSGHHGYRRMVIDALDQEVANATWHSLAALTGAPAADPSAALDGETMAHLERHTLIRKLESQFFDPDRVAWNRSLQLRPSGSPFRFELARRELPEKLPDDWRVEDLEDRRVRVTVDGNLSVLMVDHRSLGVSAAGQLPTGFDPGSLYQARSHPRAVQMTVFAASDALQSLGIEWQRVAGSVPPDQVSVYAGSAMAQLDEEGNGGLLGSRYRGRRITSKQIPMGLAEMPADFINAYILGSLGQSGHNMGACATFHYNLRHGALDIREGRSRVAIVGGAEAPLVPDVVEGLATMGALGSNQALLGLEAAARGGVEPRQGAEPDYRRACRPFGENCGFTIAEGAHFAILMDDELALELGADILGGVGQVFVHADGHKKSISSPGVGNYVTFAKAVSEARRTLGDDAVRRRSFIHAHGTGTPQNRTTESAIFDKVAAAFEISDWPVAAVKCFVGHTMAAAGGDQLSATLGVWHHGIVPGITSIDGPADDVSGDRLRISPHHLVDSRERFEVAFLNAKGFGGNNATASIYSPAAVERLLIETRGEQAVRSWRRRVEATREAALENDRRACSGRSTLVYRFDHQVRDGQHVRIDGDELTVEGYGPIKI